MKSKKFTYVLMVCVAAVWGIIFYRVYMAVTEEDAPLAAAPVAKAEYFKMVNHDEDAVTLNLNYRNPFSGGTEYFAEEKTPTNPSPIKTTSAIPTMPMAKPMINWSGISYNGFINNTATKQKLALLSINGKEAMLAEGQSANGLKLLKHAGDSVKVQYQGETKFIRIK